MKRIVIALAAVAFATSAFAADGAALYASKCKGCHGAANRFNGSNEASLFAGAFNIDGLDAHCLCLGNT